MEAASSIGTDIRPEQRKQAARNAESFMVSFLEGRKNRGGTDASLRVVKPAALAGPSKDARVIGTVYPFRILSLVSVFQRAAE